MILRGGALIFQGHAAEGIAQLTHGLAATRAIGGVLFQPYYLSLLAAAYDHVGQPQEGLRGLAEALALVEQTGERWWQAELSRLQGELMLRQGSPGRHQHPLAAEACLQQALAVARRQQAKALELRAAMSLSHLWLRQGKREDARQLLADVYGWFTECFDSADLQEARALLDELS
jgi:predicted ATPase